MNYEHKDFIGVYQDVFPEGFCQHVIDQFEWHVNNGAGSNRQDSENAPKHQKDDYQLFCNGKNICFENFGDHNVIDMFFKGLQYCFDEYVNQYSMILQGEVKTNSMKIQRTSQGGGYHLWHSEQGGGDFANRVLVFMLYLNTLEPEHCGETEFLYQERRINPVENTMVLWPAAFTHAHRGNVVYGDAHKYIVTGWFKYE